MPCDHDYVFLIACGAMVCIECAHHTTTADCKLTTHNINHHRQYEMDDCRCGWANTVQEECNAD
jgi:hypothetical protein